MIIIYFIGKKFHTNILYVQSYRVSFSTNFLLLPVPVECIQTFCATSTILQLNSNVMGQRVT